MVLHALPHAPKDERLFGGISSSLFFLLYVIPFTVFLANVEVQETGVHVEQFGTKFVAFSQLRACRNIFLWPFRVAVVITRERFPMNLLVVFSPGDDLVRILKSRISEASIDSNC